MRKKLIFSIFQGMARLPLPLLYLMADLITPVLYHLVKYRRKVVRENLTSAFPHKPIKEIIKIEKDFYRYLGDQMVETIKTLHISDRELEKRIEVVNYATVNESLEKGKNVVVMMGHYANWEWVQQISRYFLQTATMTSIYHPLNDKVFDELFIELRSRWNAKIIPMRRAPKFLLDKDHRPWVCGFIADAWTWQKHEDNVIDFLNQKTWFISGPEEIGHKVDADYFYLEMNRKSRGYYEITLHPLRPQDMSVSYPYSREFWKLFEKTILKWPAYWLWSHKRWK